MTKLKLHPRMHPRLPVVHLKKLLANLIINIKAASGNKKFNNGNIKKNESPQTINSLPVRCFNPVLNVNA